METIVAISTSAGVGGIGIIRMSGEKSFEILSKIFKRKNNDFKANTINYGKIVDNESGEIIDEVLVSFFKSPKSYTTEDMCEINSHGGYIVMQNILDLCIRNGARLAEPGEFTKRAFLNGRIDLSQAESVIDIINAKTNKERAMSIKNLQGELSKEIKEIKEILLNIMVDIEANIDYPEYDVEEISNKKAKENLQKAKEKLKKLEKSFENGKLIKEGIKVAIVGRPNAGKSSLLNAFLREERAIVTEYEGTTRDTIEEFISIEGIPIKIIDTAGIRETSEKVEKIGIEKSKKMIEDSDFVIAIFDKSKDLNEEDYKIMELIKEKKGVIVLNKKDLKEKLKIEDFKNTGKDIIEVSILKRDGIEKISENLIKKFKINEINIENETIITNSRHKQLIIEANKQIDKAIETIDINMPIDIIAVYIKESIECLSEITGENVSEDIISSIFKKFCLGK